MIFMSRDFRQQHLLKSQPSAETVLPAATLFRYSDMMDVALVQRSAFLYVLHCPQQTDKIKELG